MPTGSSDIYHLESRRAHQKPRPRSHRWSATAVSRTSSQWYILLQPSRRPPRVQMDILSFFFFPGRLRRYLEQKRPSRKQLGGYNSHRTTRQDFRLCVMFTSYLRADASLYVAFSKNASITGTVYTKRKTACPEEVPLAGSTSRTRLKL